jgi:hypothetical protein
MLSAVRRGAIHNSQFQLCIWHAAEAILAWIRKKRYTEVEIKGVKDTELGLHDLVWEYLLPTTLQDLDTNRATLIAKLNLEDHHYITDHWQSLESRVVKAYTQRYRTLELQLLNVARAGINQFTKR